MGHDQDSAYPSKQAAGASRRQAALTSLAFKHVRKHREESNMAYKIEEIEGIGPAFAKKLAIAEIKTTDDLLELCCDPKGRKAISAKTGIGEAQLLKWSNMADLMRISGIGQEYSELLEAAGVDTVKELRNRRADNLTEKMKEVNAKKKLARATPSTSVVEGWVNQAKTLGPKISY